jgi:hypothetical protein
MGLDAVAVNAGGGPEASPSQNGREVNIVLDSLRAYEQSAGLAKVQVTRVLQFCRKCDPDHRDLLARLTIAFEDAYDQLRSNVYAARGRFSKKLMEATTSIGKDGSVHNGLTEFEHAMRLQVKDPREGVEPVPQDRNCQEILASWLGDIQDTSRGRDSEKIPLFFDIRNRLATILNREFSAEYVRSSAAEMAQAFVVDPSGACDKVARLKELENLRRNVQVETITLESGVSIEALLSLGMTREYISSLSALRSTRQDGVEKFKISDVAASIKSDATFAQYFAEYRED